MADPEGRGFLAVPLFSGWRIAAAMFLLASLQCPGQETAGAIAGRVVRWGDRSPVASVTVHFLRPGITVPPVQTDAEGRFRMEGVAPGRYGLFVDPASGYRSGERIVFVRENETLTGVEIAVFPAASISGTVWRGRSRPAQGVRVWAVSVPEGGQHAPHRLGVALTDDQGRFAIRGLAPGRYRIQAEIPPQEVREMDWNDDAPPGFPPEQEILTSTFYPDTTEAGLAAPVEAAAGEETQGVEIQLARVRTSCVRARLKANPHHPGPFQILVLPYDDAAGPPLASGQVHAGRGFQICGIPRGAWLLLAAPPGPRDPGLYATLPFQMGAAPLRLADLDPAPLPPLAGRILVENSEKPEPFAGPVHLVLHAVRRALVFHQQGHAVVDAPGEFAFPAVLPEEYWLEIRCPPGMYPAAALYQGQDVLRRPFLAAGGELLIRLRSGGPGLRVTVMDEEGGPVASGAVLLAPDPLPQPPSRWDVRYELADQNGMAVFDSLPPGRYRIIALAEGLMDPTQRFAAYERLRAKGEAVRLEPGVESRLALRPAERTGGR